MRRKILFITGSMNQTVQMHLIANELPDFDCWFSQLFTDSALINNIVENTTIVNSTVLSTTFKSIAENYLLSHNLQLDYRALKNNYDLVVYCSDMIIPKRMRPFKTVWIQEGMIDKYTLKSRLIRALNVPTWTCGDTSLNGSSNICDVYCAASIGYKNHFTKYGTSGEKIFATGMPNYDDLKRFVDNDFPYHNYVMVATTDFRETYRFENRPLFIKKAAEIANGRPMLFKLHPNERFERAEAEIKKHAPYGTLIFQHGNTNEMIANCDELITQYSTVVYTGIALGKKVHSYFNVKDLEKLTPIQNGGTSARNIASICRAFAMLNGPKAEFAKTFKYRPALFKYTPNKQVLKAVSA